MPLDQLGDDVVAFAPRGRQKVQEIIDAMAGDSTEFAAQMESWLGGLPTADPQVAGKPFLSAGVLTVSGGA